MPYLLPVIHPYFYQIGSDRLPGAFNRFFRNGVPKNAIYYSVTSLRVWSKPVDSHDLSQSPEPPKPPAKLGG